MSPSRGAGPSQPARARRLRGGTPGSRTGHLPVLVKDAQFFGEVAIDGGSRALTVRLRDQDGAVLFTVTLDDKSRE